jgi:glycosyltransferase involved in cell wall biosynthesis
MKNEIDNKLTIIIPTYNRANFLDQTLSVIVNQISLLDSVTVLVVDGNSTDNTQEICNKYSKISSSFESILLEEKGGVDKDIDIGVRNSTSEYCWLFCDDDSMIDGAVLNIYNKLLDEEPDVMIINSSVCNFDLNKTLKVKSIGIESDLIIDHEPDMQDQLFELCGKYLSFTGAFLFRREKWCNVDTSKFYGNRFADMCTIAQFEGNESKVVILEHPYILIRLGNAEWSDISFKIWYESFPNAINNHCNLSEKIKSILVPNSIYWLIKFLLWHRAVGSYTYKHYQFYFKNSRLIRKYIAIFISVIPRYLPWALFYLLALSRRNSLSLHDLGEGRLSKNSWKSSN